MLGSTLTDIFKETIQIPVMVGDKKLSLTVHYLTRTIPLFCYFRRQGNRFSLQTGKYLGN